MYTWIGLSLVAAYRPRQRHAHTQSRYALHRHAQLPLAHALALYSLCAPSAYAHARSYVIVDCLVRPAYLPCLGANRRAAAPPFRRPPARQPSPLSRDTLVSPPWWVRPLRHVAPKRRIHAATRSAPMHPAALWRARRRRRLHPMYPTLVHLGYRF